MTSGVFVVLLYKVKEAKSSAYSGMQSFFIDSRSPSYYNDSNNNVRYETMNRKPNIVIMYADDLGYADVSCYGAKGIQTPNVDRLGHEGVKFEGCYTTAATCTPARYSLLTGIYPWRNQDAMILPGDAPLIISRDTYTMPQFLRDQGYATGIVGKWHLGIGHGTVNWNENLEDCPLDVGFDESFIMAATNDRVPCVFIDGRKVYGVEEEDPIEVSYADENPYPEVPTGRDNPELLKVKHSHGHDGTIINGVGRIGYMRGGEKAKWVDENMADIFLNRAIQYVEDHKEEPFFLYYALHEPHVPRVPNPRFIGTTGLGPRGDSIAEMDWCVGQMLDTLDRLGLADNTIVIFSSDNGPVLDDGYQDQAPELTGDHRPTGPHRGGKYSLFNGGTRVPCILRWPVKVEAGINDTMWSQVDLYASFAALAGAQLPEEAAIDSENMLDVIMNHPEAAGRKELVTEGAGHHMNYHAGDWVYIPPYPGPAVQPNTGIEMGYDMEPQLYNIRQDIGQYENLAAKYPERLHQMASRLDEILKSERTREV